MGKTTRWLLLAKKVFTPSRRRKSRDKAHAAIASLLETSDVKQEPVSVVTTEQKEQQEHVPVAVHVVAAEEIDEVRSNVASEEEEPFPITPAPSSCAPEDKLREELAAVRIQAAFRAFQAKRKLKELKGLSRLQSTLHGKATRKQTFSALRSMQSFTRMQRQVRVQRSRMTELELQRKQDLEKEKPESEQFCLSPEDWDDTTLSKEQIKAKMQTKQRAAIKRERTLAYAFSNQQWRSYPKDLTAIDGDQAEKLNWSWSWLEQWMFTRDWKVLQDGDISPANASSQKKTTKQPASSSSPTSTSAAAAARKLSPVSKITVPKISSPKIVPPKVPSTRVASPKVPSQVASPTVLSQVSSPKAVSQVASPKVSSQVASPRVPYQCASPKVPSQCGSPRGPSQCASPKVSPSKVGSPKVQSPQVGVGSPLRRLSPANKNSLRKPTPILSVTKAGKVLNGDENQPRASPGRMQESFSPGTPERDTKNNPLLRKKTAASNGRLSPAMSPNVQKSPGMVT